MKLISYCIQQPSHWITFAVLIALTSCGGQRSTPVARPPSNPVAPPSQAASPSISSAPSTPIASNPTEATPTPSATTSPTPDATGTVSLQDGRVTFKLPPGFTAMTAEEINLKFPPRGGDRPQYVYGNDRRNVAIAITFSKARVTPQQLPELQAAIRRTIVQVFPNAEWKSEERTTINNTPWVHLEFVTQAIDTKIHNDTYLTSFDGKMLGFNFNSTVEQYESNKSELQKTRDSITIR